MHNDSAKADLKASLRSLVRRWVYPHLKNQYHALYIRRTKRRLAKVGERGVVLQHFLEKHGRIPNLDNPATFAEKLAWTKLHCREPLMVQCADKYAVREYVRETVGEKYLIPLLGVYDDPSEIPFEELPTPYVLKVNHASGGNSFCFDKKSFDAGKAARVLKHHLKINAYYYGCEWAYRDIPPRIVCEQVLLDEQDRIPNDYKIFCFNGEPAFIQVDFDRFTDHRRNFYDCEFKLLPMKLLYQQAEVDLPRPHCLDEMLQVARKLSTPFDFARVDVYVVRGSIYFGEITFYPEGGAASFSPESCEIEYGAKLRLSKLPQ